MSKQQRRADRRTMTASSVGRVAGRQRGSSEVAIDDSFLRIIAALPPARVTPVVFAAIALSFHTLSYSATSWFYAAFGVTPEEVGFSYVDVLGKRALQVASASLIAMIVLITLILLVGLALAVLRAHLLDFLSGLVRDGSGYGAAGVVQRMRRYTARLAAPRFSTRRVTALLVVAAMLASYFSRMDTSRDPLGVVVVLTVLSIFILNFILPSRSSLPISLLPDREARKFSREYPWLARNLLLCAILSALWFATIGLDSLLGAAGIRDMVVRVSSGQGLPLEPIAINPLRIVTPTAHRVNVTWIGAEIPPLFKTTEGGKKDVVLTFFGQAKGTTVLFEPVSVSVLRLPSANLIIRASAR